MTQPTVGTPERRGAGWFVPSGQVGYFVERVDGRWRCTCPAARWRRQQRCKHVLRVMQEQRKAVTMG